MRFTSCILSFTFALFLGTLAYAGPQQNPKSTITAQPPAADASATPTVNVKAPRATTTLDLQPGEHLDINTATVADFEKLPSVGPVLAKAIFDYREANGAYQRVEDLMNVPGIGQGRFRQMQPWCQIDDKTIDAWKPQTDTANRK